MKLDNNVLVSQMNYDYVRRRLVDLEVALERANFIIRDQQIAIENQRASINIYREALSNFHNYAQFDDEEP